MGDQLESILAEHPPERSSLIPLLQDIQHALGYIPPEAMSAVARHLGVPETAVYGVVTFYAQFYLTRQGRHRIKVCQGTACHVRGARKVLDALQERLGIGPGETTEDYRVTLERVACFGSCALAPVVVVDGEVHGRMTTQRAHQLLEELE